MTSAQETGRFWLCPKCGRHVPGRLEACRCGATRPEGEAAPAVGPGPQPLPASAPAGDMVYANENPLFTISLVISAVVWLIVLVGTLGFALIYAALFFVFYLFAQSGVIAYIKGTAVKLTPQQYPDLHERLTACCRRLGLAEVPQTYLLHGNGVFNAFATRFLGRHFVVLLSDVVDALESRPGAVNFYLGHELAHIQRRHLVWGPVLLPASLLPLIGAAYHRAREATCDNYGAACCDDPQDAVVGLSVLAAGRERWKAMSSSEYVAQARETSGFWMSFHELVSDYPWLVKRVARVTARAQGLPPDVPSRHPLAYVFAIFVPRTGAGGGGGLASLLMVVAVIGIIAAIAIPSLLRARVSANEAAAIGDVRTVVSAEAAFASQARNYGPLECLASPSTPGCLSRHPATSPTFIDPAIAGLAPKSGYERAFVPGEPWPTERSPNGVKAFCYSAFPITAGQTGVRSFAGDHTGRICVDPGGRNLCTAAELPFDCTPLQ
jgi:Zn-dependent protease with chaperone function/type II secretory pathway pseudopilin PulG